MRWTENLRGLRAQEVSRLAESQKYREQRSLVRWFIRINSRKYNASRIKWNGPGPIINSGSCNDRLICNAISRRVVSPIFQSNLSVQTKACKWIEIILYPRFISFVLYFIFISPPQQIERRCSTNFEKYVADDEYDENIWRNSSSSLRINRKEIFEV